LIEKKSNPKIQLLLRRFRRSALGDFSPAAADQLDPIRREESVHHNAETFAHRASLAKVFSTSRKHHILAFTTAPQSF